MKLKNKKTGKIVELQVHNIAGKCYESLADVNEDWEDYEEPKEYWFINDLDGKLMKCESRYCRARDFTEWSEKRKQLGNYFETKEEAEKAVEKLKAWRRLKNNGFKFTAYQLQELNIKFFLDHGYTKMGDDLDLLFGGEE